jgi:hypothetical protein
VLATLQNRKRLVFPKWQTLPTVQTKRKIVTNHQQDHRPLARAPHKARERNGIKNSEFLACSNECRCFRLQRNWPLNWYPQDFNSYCYYGANTNLQHVQLHPLWYSWACQLRCSFARIHPKQNLFQQASPATKSWPATSLHMRDKDRELWLGHLASLIGCMSSIGVSDPVNV